MLNILGGDRERAYSEGIATEEEERTSKNQRNTPRMPATKFANLRKKMQKQQVQTKVRKKK